MSYGRIKETTIGGYFISRSYRHISQYENEIAVLRSQGISRRKICEKYGFTMEQLKNFITRYNRKQEKIKAGVALRTKGRPPKEYEITEDMKISELKYIIARKDSKIKRLEMENALMRDFLSLTERKSNRQLGIK